MQWFWLTVEAVQNGSETFLKMFWPSEKFVALFAIILAVRATNAGFTYFKVKSKRKKLYVPSVPPGG